jgi:hypothetical protein
MIRHDLGDAALSFGQDLQPEQHGPKPIFLADMVAASAKAFLSAEGDLPRRRADSRRTSNRLAFHSS